MKNRNIFAELTEGFDALPAKRAGKITLRTVKVTRKHVFANCLRTNPQTLENWERGSAKPYVQVALLIWMANLFTDVVQRSELL